MSDDQIFQAGEPASASLQFPTNPPHRILVVDHDPYTCHLRADVLIRHGYEVNAAEDGAAGWEELQANNYNLLITEHELPKITGVKLVRKLRAARMALPVVLIAGRLPARELARNPPLRLAATLLKPLAAAALLYTVKIVLRATDISLEQIAPPPSSQIPPSVDGWQLKLIAVQASAPTPVSRKIGETYGAYSHWGLND
jgi:DNA-binding response OmpR family regulator